MISLKQKESNRHLFRAYIFQREGAVKKQPIKTTQLPLQEKFEGATAFFMLIVEKLSNYLKTGYNEQARRKNAFFALINIYFIDSSGGF